MTNSWSCARCGEPNTQDAEACCMCQHVRLGRPETDGVSLWAVHGLGASGVLHGSEREAIEERLLKIAATYGFEAAHQLHKLPDGHKCKRLHGHNYTLEVSISGDVDERGFVIDYAELDAVVQPLVDRLDHRFLNEIEGLDNPTSEVLVMWFKTRIMVALPGYAPTVRIYETPRYWVEA